MSPAEFECCNEACDWKGSRAETVHPKRLHNIITGCPVCSELERNIRPATNSNPR
jgi:hypothetical protein